ncbi:hypothetical protein BM1_03957 [Bipolaris maydis]|nr:hypothetical protein BM1_03957 [Bipolaris maydis]
MHASKYYTYSRKLEVGVVGTKAIARLQKTTLQQSKQPNKPRQLRAITSSIPSTKEIEEIISYRFRPWDSLNYNISISKKSKEEEAAAHKDYIQTIEDNSIVIYSDASKTKDRDGIGVGLAVYNPNQEEIYAETKNIGEQQLVYNGELEGVTAAFEYAAKTAQKDQNIHVYADNQAAIYRLQSLSDKPGQQWVIRCQKAAKAILNRKAKIFLKWAPGHTDIEGNERADALAKEATKQTPKKSQTSLAFLGTKIKLLQRASQAEEWRKYREKVREKKTSYGAIFDLKLKNQLAIPRGTKRDILSSFYSLKIGHGYFNSYLKRVKRRECDLCRCGKPQTAEHLLRYCGFYSVERNQLKKTLNQKILKLPRLLHTTSGSTLRNPFSSQNRTPKATTVEEALEIARNLVIQAANLAENNPTQQTSLLDLVEVFRDYTETGRVSKKNSAILGDQISSLSNVSKELRDKVRRLEKPIPAQPNQQGDRQTAALTQPISYAAIAAANKEQQWTTMQKKAPQKAKPSLKERQLVLVNQGGPAAFDALRLRNAFNQAFTLKGGVQSPVVASVTLSSKGNKVVTTTPAFTANYLLENQGIWKDLVAFKVAQPITSWFKIVVHRLPTNHGLEVIKEEIETFNKGLKVQSYSSAYVAFATKEEALKAIRGKLYILGESLRAEKLQVINNLKQCSKCQGFGHLKARNSPATKSALDLAIKVDARIVADFTQILPTPKDTSLRPRVLFYIRKDLKGEVNPFISDDNDFLAIKRRLLQEILQPQLIILGDFNTHYPRWSLEERSPSTQAEELTTFKETLGQEIKVLDLEKRLSILPPCSNYTSRKLILGQNILLETKLDELGEDLTRAIQKALEKSTLLEAFLQKDSPKEIFKALAYTKDNLSTRIPAIKGKESFTKKCKAFREDLFPPPPTTATPSFHIYRGDSRWTWPALTEDELSFAYCKVLERLVARRLGALAETTDLLHPSQLGGRLKKSAIDAALLFYNNIQQQKRKQKTTTTIFLNIKGAFDHVSKNKLLETKSFLEDRILQLSFNGQTEEPQVISTGTPQGSPTSPILFLIYLKPLFNAIQTNANIYSSSYIDDLQISISSTLVRKNIKLLEKEIQNLFRLAEKSAIQFDSSKTELKIVQSKELVRWLGVYFDCSLKFKHHSLIRNQQASAAFHRLSRLANSNKGLSPRAVRQLYLACITSVANYSCQIFWREQQTALNQRQKLQNQACRKILGSFRTSPAIPSEVEAALYPPRVRLNNALRQYAFRARKLAPSYPLNIAITSNQGKQLERITRSISTALSDDTKHHKELLEDEYLLSIYSDASATKEGKGIGVGVAFYKGASLIAYEKVNIGYNQLVYNGELEGITLGLEKAFDLADDYLEVRVYADNQAAIFRLKTASDYPGQEWQLRCTIAAEKLQEKGILPTIQWVPGHQGVIGNERADALAKEATKLDPSSSRTSLAVIGTRIKQLGEREWLSYLGQYRRKAITLNPTTYAARYKWKTRKQIATPPTSREASSAFYQLKLGHCYLRDFLFKRGKVDSKVCPCNYRATQDPAHILLSCTLYKEARKKMQETTKDPLSLAFLLDTTVGVQATIAFIKETRAATQAWYKGNLDN